MTLIAMMLCYWCGFARDCTFDGHGWICDQCRRDRGDAA